MSFSRLNDDACTYQHNLKQSVGVSEWILSTPGAGCKPCFRTDRSQQSQNVEFMRCKNKAPIDVSSELLGITRKASNCPSKKYIPNKYCETEATLSDCTHLPDEPTRLSNPPCTMRGSGWNRWEWTCKNPQDKALVPFDYMINNRLVVKDNHRPCVQMPMDQEKCLPPFRNDDSMFDYGKLAAPCGGENPLQLTPSTTWKPCAYLDKYAIDA